MKVIIPKVHVVRIQTATVLPVQLPTDFVLRPGDTITCEGRHYTIQDIFPNGTTGKFTFLDVPLGDIVVQVTS